MKFLKNLFRNKIPKFKVIDSFIILPAIILVIISSTILYKAPQASNIEKYHKHLISSIKKSSDFSDYIENLFKYEVTANSVTMAYTLKNPEKYNIPKLNPQLTDFSIHKYAKDSINKTTKNTTSELYNKLETIQKNNLSSYDQVTYDLISKHLKLSEQLCDFPYYESFLGKTTGAASNIPVTFSEYPLNSANDVETYFILLKQIPEHFENIIKYENDRIKKGISTPEFILRDTEKELAKFLKNLNSDNNCFVTTFNERVQKISSLSIEERNKYISNNKYYVNQYILPAYQTIYNYIIDNIKTNTTDSKSQNNSTLAQSQSKNSYDLPNINKSYGLANYKKGKEYYELLVKYRTGSYRPISELINITEDTLKGTLSNVLQIAVKEPDAYIYYCEHPLDAGYNSPEGILEALSLMTRENYPILNNTPEYSIKTVPNALAEGYCSEC